MAQSLGPVLLVLFRHALRQRKKQADLGHGPERHNVADQEASHPTKRATNHTGPRPPIRQCTRRQEEFVLIANWHQKDRSHWQRQLGQYIASNSGRQFVLFESPNLFSLEPSPENRSIGISGKHLSRRQGIFEGGLGSLTAC
jgi:hypothetical protein